ncbi:flagellar hook-associated protein FlgK [Luteimonas abyssi]|uniref:flagellar hook-associated protein FlgK n=1 Tax=Luteimonas abyssi TaxID=1247514 RepID=UPI000737B250|nr:flagellar hook-associated protein FlgK [Luteimonas abyssi]
MPNVLSTGTSALMAFQRALATVSHNVANVNTPGYSRQRVEFEARNPAFVGVGYIGSGTQVSDIRRVVDDLANARLIESGGELARLQQLSTLSSRVDVLFSDSATNLAGVWSNFFDSVSALSSNAGSSAERASVLAQATALTTRFHQLGGHLDGLEREVNDGMRSGAGEINRLTAEIARLNGQIGANGANAAPDLLDRRERLVGELVAYTGGAAVVQDGGAMNVFTAGGQALVVGTTASQVVTVADPYQPQRLQLALDSQGHRIPMDARVLGGAMGGLIEFRASVLDPSRAELGRIAAGLAHSFNEAHAAGVDLYGTPGGEFFRLPPPTVAGHAGNGGNASFAADFDDLGQLDGADVVLRFQDGAWTARHADSGAVLEMTGAGTAGDPLRINGVALTLSGTPAEGDRFLLQPTAKAATGISLAITDPSRIAAASPVGATADLGNTGTGKVAGVRITDAADPNLRTPAEIVFIDANTYAIDGGEPQSYTPGDVIAGPGWSLVLDGVPAAGDGFSIVPTAAGSSDNGNALHLAGLDDARMLNGGTVTLNGAIGGLTTAIGSTARQAEYSADAQRVIHQQAQASRDAVSGVNLDEEAANLLRLQQAYQAASQIIATADTLFQSILGAVRR